MKLKIRCLPLALVALLAAAGAAPAQSADITQIREHAAQGWHQTYEAYGRTITVDIPIQVPDADQYPVLSATFTPQLTKPVVSDWPSPTVYQDIDFFRLDSHSTAAVREDEKNNPPDYPPSGMYRRRRIYKGINELDLDTAYAYNNPSTVRDGLSIMETVWADNFPDVQIEFMPYAVYATDEMRVYNEATDSFSGDPWHYQAALMAYMHQVIDGIPVLCPGEQCFAHFDKTPYREGNLRLGGTTIMQKLLDDTTMFTVAITQHTYVKTDIVHANLPLCGLDQVIQTYEQLITAGLLRQVSSLELGYVSWQTAEERFTLIPTWVLIGYLYPDAETPTPHIPQYEHPHTMEYGVVLVNAQTGALIDPANIDIGSLYP